VKLIYINYIIRNKYVYAIYPHILKLVYLWQDTTMILTMCIINNQEYFTILGYYLDYEHDDDLLYNHHR
jgi:hypothetical protein